MSAQITITIDPTDRIQVKAALDLIKGLAGEEKTSTLCVTATEVLETKPGKTTNKKVTEMPKAEPKKEEPAAQPEPAVDEDLDGGAPEVVKIEEVRALLAKKVTDNRDAIKAKLTALGAANVSTMKESDYPAFLTFLKGLK